MEQTSDDGQEIVTGCSIQRLKRQEAMKVLLITTTYPTPARPRQGAFNQVLVEALCARHDVRVIAPIPWTQAFCGTATASCCSRTLHPTYYYPPRVFREYYHHFYWRSIRSSIQRLEREFKPDIVMGYWLHPDGAAAVRAAERYRVPSIVMSGGTDLRLLPRQTRRQRAIARVLARADRLVVFSRELAAQADRLGVAPGVVDVVYRGVNRECFYPADQAVVRTMCGEAPSSVVVFWAGRFELVKNPTMLLHAAVHWKREWSHRLRVILAGDGPLRNRLCQLRRQLDLEDVVLFAGNLTQSELALRYNAADVTVLTSHSEGIPNVLLESIACGTPFVATDVGGVAEIATPGIDHLVPADDVNAMTDAVIQHVRTAPEGRRAFVPTDLVGMADQFDAVMARVTAAVPGPARRAAWDLHPTSHVPTVHQAFQEPAG